MNIITRCISVPVALALISTMSFSWGPGTHTYQTNQLGAHWGKPNLSEMYGAVLPDAFNLVLSDQGQFIYDKLHHDPMRMVAAAGTCDQRSAAFGFVSHNDNWGADWTAHHRSLVSRDSGYAVIKGVQLVPMVQPALYQILRNADPQLPEPIAEMLSYGLAPDIGHDLAETAVDLLIKRRDDPLIGARMVLAARCRPNSIPALLADAYAEALSTTFGISLAEARAFLIGVEEEWRQQMIQYGQMFLLPEDGTIAALAQMNAAVAEVYLEYFAAANGYPTDVTVPTATAESFIRIAMNVVQPDYRRELNATLAHLRRELQQRSVYTCRPFGKDGEPVIASVDEPLEFSLGENYPNPFNPSTTISFRVPSTAVVSLDIFNVIGQRVRCLVDGRTYESGEWHVTWDGKSDAGAVAPTGVYFTRLTTPQGIFTRKMQMIK